MCIYYLWYVETNPHTYIVTDEKQVAANLITAWSKGGFYNTVMQGVRHMHKG